MRKVLPVRKSIQCLVCIGLLLCSLPSFASHFRGGTMSWQPAGGNKIKFTVTSSWRKSYYTSNYPSVPIAVGNRETTGSFYFGNGITGALNAKITSWSDADDVLNTTWDTTYDYVSAGIRIVNALNTTARINNTSIPNCTVVDGNADSYFNMQSIVNVGATPSNSSPVSSLPPIINVATGLANYSLFIPASDPDGDALTYRLANPLQPLSLTTTTDQTRESGLNYNPQATSATSPAYFSGFSLNSTTGQISFSTTGAAVGSLHLIQVMVSDGKTKTPVDFVVRIVAASNPPAFTSPTTTSYTTAIGSPMSFVVTATPQDAARTVTLTPVSIPVGSTMTPSLPLTGTVGAAVSSTFSWTPSSSQTGTYVITFVAQNDLGLQVFKSINITVPCALDFTSAVTSATCAGKSNGAAVISVSNFSSTSNLTYQWTGPNGFTASTKDISNVPAGTYSLKVSDAGTGCLRVNSVVIGNTLTLNPTASSNSPICEGGILALNASGATTYAWSGPNSFASTVQNASISNVSIADAGSYSVIVTDGSTGCQATASTNVVVNAIPTVTASSNSPVNQGSSINLTGNGATTYSWSGPSGFTATTQNASVANAQPVNAGTYSVTGTTNGCSASATTTVSVNPPATALNFDGSNDYVKVTNSGLDFTSTSFTIEAWAKRTPQGNYQMIFSQGGLEQVNKTIHFGFRDNGNFTFAFYGNDLDAVGYSDLNWHHWAATYNAGTKARKIYRDGVLIAQDVSNGAYLGSGNTDYFIGITCYFSGLANGLNGSVDEMRIWSRDLCQGEIQNNMSNEISPATQTGLAAYYQFNEGFVGSNNSTVTTLTDQSGHNRNGVLNNFALTGSTSNWTIGNVSGTAPSFVAPSVSITTTTAITFCAGGSVVLTANASNAASPTFQWYNNSTAINGATASTYTATTSGNYTVTVTANGCTGTSTATTVTVNPIPVVTISSTGNSVCPSQTVTLTASGASTYLWSNSATSSSINVGAGTYSVTGTALGCSATSSSVSITANSAPSIAGVGAYVQGSTTANSCTGVINYPAVTVSGTPAPTVTYQFTNATTGTGSGTGSGQTFNKGVTHVVVTATNTCGTQSASFDVTLVDDVKPVAVCKPVTIALDASGQASVTAQQVDNGSTDNCGPVTLSVTSTGIICGTAAENNSVTLAAPAGSVITAINFASYGTPNGSCGNFTLGSCNATNSVSKVSAVAIGQNSVTIPATNAFFGDPCGGTVKRLYIQATYSGPGNASTFDCSKLGPNPVVLTVKDADGNVSTCTSTVTVVDNIAPVISCPSAQTLNLGSNCSVALPDYRSLLTVSDNCTSPALLVITQTPAPGTIVSGTGTMNVSFTVSDASNNSSNCGIVVTKKDVTPPVITCVAPISVNNDVNSCGAVVTYPTPTATDGCSTPSGSQTFSYTGSLQNFVVPSGVSNVTITVKGAQGGGTLGGKGASMQGTFTTIPGSTYKILVGGVGVTNSRSGGGGGTFVTDNSNNPVIIAGGGGGAIGNICGGIGGYPGVTGTSGTTAGSVYSGGAGTNGGGGGGAVQGSGGGGGGFIGNGGSGRCGSYCGVGGAGGNGTNGSDGTCGPYIAPGGNSFLNGGNGGLLPASNGASGGYGGGGSAYIWNCGGGGGGGYSGGGGGSYNNITYEGGGGGGSYNAGANQNNLAGDNAGDGSVTISWTGTSATVTQTAGLASGSLFPIGTTTNTFVATDAAGNTSTCSFDVTVTDNQKPVITTNGNQSANNVPGTCGAAVSVSATATDNCSVGAPTGVRSDGLALNATYPVGTTTITWNVTDANGVAALPVSQTVIVTDNEKPSLIGVLANATVECSAVPAPATVTAADNCPGVGAVNYNQTITAGSCPGKYTITRTWSVTDAHNNSTTATQTITVQDTQAPTLAGVPADVTVSCANVPAAAQPTATDNCDASPVVTLAQTSTQGASGSNQYNYTITRTWTATDNCGNHNSATQVITVQDVTPPVLTTAANQDVNLNASCSITIPDVRGTATDNCSTPVITQSPAVGAVVSSSHNATTTVTVTATDGTGLTTVKTVVLTAKDVTPPVLTAAANQNVNLGASCSITVPDVRGTATDNCSGVVITQNPAVGAILSSSHNATINVTVTATDAAGLTDVKTVVLTVKDVTPPVITCVAPISVNNDVNSCGAVVNFSGGASLATGTVPQGAVTLSYSGCTPMGVVYNPLKNVYYAVGGGYPGCTMNNYSATGALVSSVTGNFDWRGSWWNTNTNSFEGNSYGTAGYRTVTLDANGLATGNGTNNPVGSFQPDYQSMGGYDAASNQTVFYNGGSLYYYNRTTGALVSSGAITGLPSGSITGNWAASTGITGKEIILYDYSNRAVRFINKATRAYVASVTLAPTAPTPSFYNVGYDGNGKLWLNNGSSWLSYSILSGNASSGGITATDNCTGVTIAQTAGLPSGSLFPIGTTTNTFVATDAAGNTATCSFDVTVTDNQKPVITTNGNKNVNNDLNVCGAAVSVSATATDNCSVGTPTGVRSDGLGLAASYPVGTTTITWNVTDIHGNAALPVTQTVTVTDNQKPVLVGVPATATVECSAVPSPAIVTATDNCPGVGVVNYNQTITPGSCPGKYTITRTWSVTDAHNNTTTASQVIHVQDTQAPTLAGVPADVTVSCDNVPAAAQPTATDNCDAAPVVTLSQVSTQTASGVGHYNYTITRTWTATDACSNHSSATQVVTVQDVTAPVLAGVPADATVNCDAVPTAAQPTATDNCDASPVITLNEVSTQTATGVGHYNYTITRTWTATDVAGNNSSATQVVTVQDVTAPVLAGVPADVTVNCDAVPTAAQPTATDNCDASPVITLNEVSTQNADVNNVGHYNYTITRTWTATDVAGNNSSATQVVTVQDVTAPVITCPASVTVNCQDNNSSSATGVATGTDNCSPVAITEAQTSTQDADINSAAHYNYVITRTWRATDVTGNYSECVQTITVQDVTAPVITCPASVTVNCQDNNSSSATGVATATDNCSPVAITETQTSTQDADINNAAHYNYVITRTWRATDVTGNYSECVQTITVQDVTAPVITCPASVTVNCQDNNSSSATGVATGTDNCSPVAITETQTSTQDADINNAAHYNYVITRTWRATDVTGNYSECVQTITVQDVTAPVITCPASVTVNCQDNNSSSATGVATGTDNCSPVAITETQTSTQDADINNAAHYNYVITRTWRATDVTGNYSECVQTITVQDITKPVITCPASVTVNCQDNNSSSATGVATATDNCSPVAITETQTSTQSADINNAAHYNYVITRTWRATDVTGNYSECVQTVTVQDVTAPVITCPASVTVNCQDNNSSSATGVATATDNCSPVAITQSQTSTQNADINNAAHYNYVITRTWRATDVTGNYSECVQTVTVQDVTAPVITCPASVTVNCQDNNSSSATGVATATDNCSPVAITQSQTSTQNADINNAAHYNYVITRTWRATDVTGNYSECVQTITVQDVTAPVITCPASVTVNCQDNNSSSATGVATGTDNCSPVAITETQTSTQDADINNVAHYNYVITRTWRATDVSGNYSECVQTVTVQDVTKPVITCPASVTVNCQDNNSSSATGVATATDNCSPVAITQSQTSTQNADINNVAHYNYVITRTWRATDVTGNYSECVQTVTVQDITKPVITCPASVTVNCQDNNSSSATGVATATDNCSPVAITQSQTSTQNANINNAAHYNYVITRTWRATDVTGNYSECVQTITVQDVTKPVITCPASVTVNCQDNNSSSATGVATGTDICSPVAITQSQVSTQDPAVNSAAHYNYVITRTWRATDVTGNYSECVQTITVHDVTAPVITCPASITQCDNQQGNNQTLVLQYNDNCGVGSVSYEVKLNGVLARSGLSGDASGSFAVGTNVITWTVKDYSGNTSMCTTTVTINPLPVAGITVGTDAFCNGVTLTATSTLSGPFSYKWLYSGNIIGTTASINLGNTSANGVYSAIVTDNKGCVSPIAATYTYDKQAISGNYTIIGLNDVRLGESNNVQTGSIGVTSLNGDASFKKNSSVASAGAFVKASTIHVQNPVNIPLRFMQPSTVSLPAMQLYSGNYTGLANYIVNNNTTVTLSANYQTLYVKSGSNVTLTGSTFRTVIVEEGATVNFTNTTLNMESMNVGLGYYTGIATVKFANNTSVRVSKQVKVESRGLVNPDGVRVNFYLGDTQCDEEKFFVRGNGAKVIANVYVPNGSIKVQTDCSTGWDWNDDDDHGGDHDGNQNGNHDRTTTSNNSITNKDDDAPACTTTYMTGLFIASEVKSGKNVIWNNNNCNTSVITADTLAPVITCPAGITVSCSSTAPAATGTATATDNSGSVTVTYSDVSTQNINPYSAGYYNYIITRTWKAKDGSGNIATCAQTITVQDRTAPVITCPGNMTINCDVSCYSTATGVATATDNCSPVTITQTQTSTQNANVNSPAHNNYVITRTWRATDISGNYSECVQNITVHDVTAPVAICHPVTVQLVNGIANIVAADVNNGSYDNCGPVTVSISKTKFACGDIGSNPVTLTVTDVSGNSSTCSTVVYVIGEAPTCSISSVPTGYTYTGGVSTNLYLGYGAQSTTLQVNAPSSGAPYTYAWTGNTSLLSSVTSRTPVFTPTAAGSYTFTVVTTNRYGCASACTITICVTDVRVPGTNGTKVYVCHLDATQGAQTLSVLVALVPLHVGYHSGDRLGSCTTTPCGGAITRGITPVTETEISVEALTVEVSPNPTLTHFVFHVSSNDKSAVTIRIMDAGGRLVEEARGVSIGAAVRMGDKLTSGYYFAEVIQNNQKKIVKLIKGN